MDKDEIERVTEKMTVESIKKYADENKIKGYSGLNKKRLIEYVNNEIDKIFPLVPFVDFVQVMGIEHVGFQGQDFDDRCITHIKELREKFFDDIAISVDGAVDFETAPRLINAGADKLVIGSAIFNTSDIISTIEEFKNL